MSRQEAPAAAKELAADGLVEEVRFFFLVARSYGSTKWHCKGRGVLQLDETLFLSIIYLFVGRFLILRVFSDYHGRVGFGCFLLLPVVSMGPQNSC